jgi:hypothetical protein
MGSAEADSLRESLMKTVTAKNTDITNVEIVVYVLAMLGGAERTVYSEDIAAKSYALAPSHFSWRRKQYRERGWPDKYVVKTALEDAKKPEYGATVEGRYALELAKDGWKLTAAGVKWLRENAQRIEAALNVKRPEIPKKEALRFMRELRGQALFKEFLKSQKVEASSTYLFTDMLNCTPDAAPDVVASKFGRSLTMAELVQDADISSFLKACAVAFPQLCARNQDQSLQSKEGDR